MATEEITEVEEQKPNFLQTLGAAIAGMIAVKLVTFLLTTGWRLATREEPPQADDPAPVGKKALWIGLIGAGTGAARQAARDYIKPPGGGPA